VSTTCQIIIYVYNHTPIVFEFIPAKGFTILPAYVSKSEAQCSDQDVAINPFLRRCQDLGQQSQSVPFLYTIGSQPRFYII
jgi:hypothetical protein